MSRKYSLPSPGVSAQRCCLLPPSGEADGLCPFHFLPQLSELQPETNVQGCVFTPVCSIRAPVSVRNFTFSDTYAIATKPIFPFNICPSTSD